MKTVLTLHLKKRWWDQIKNGEKAVELRRVTDYWSKRLVGKEYDEIHLLCGYPKRGDEAKILRRKWRGFSVDTVTHDEFGEPAQVFVIDVSESVKGT